MLVRHRWALLAVTVMAIVGAVTLLPFTRGDSVAFDLTSRSGPAYLATVCLPRDARVTMVWNTSSAAPGYTMTLQDPSGATTRLAGSVDGVDFFSEGGSYYISAENVTDATVSVHVQLDWLESGSLYQLYLTPPAACSAA